MAIASTRTGLSLDRFAEILGIHPLHFNQIDLDQSNVCGYPILQYAWQSADRTSREGIAEAIAQAEQQIEMNLGFSLTGKWVEGEQHTFRTQSVHMKSDNYYVIEGGIEAKSLVQAEVSIAYTDSDSDTYKETATIIFSTTVINPDELEVYYPGEDGDDDFQIRNLKSVVISGGTATIKFRREQCLKLKYLMDMFDPRAQLDDSDSKFLSTVDVYRRYNDPSSQADLITYPDANFRNGEYIGNSCSSCGGNGCQSCAYSIQSGCIRIVEGRNGILGLVPATWNASDNTYTAAQMCSRPNRVRLNYYAGLGYKGSYIRMAPEWERAVAYYALSLLERPVCQCSHLSAIGNMWKQDLAVMENFSGRITRSAPQNAIIQCPLGTTRAAINAWRLIQNFMIIEAGIHA